MTTLEVAEKTVVPIQSQQQPYPGRGILSYAAMGGVVVQRVERRTCDQVVAGRLLAGALLRKEQTPLVRFVVDLLRILSYSLTVVQ